MKPKTIEALTAAGWTPDRNIDITKYEEAYAKEGMVLFEPTRAFLRKFGGLLIKYQSDQFHRTEILAFFTEETVQGYGRIKEPNNPIGDCFHDHQLAMDEEGRMWLYYTHKKPDVFAETGEEAIDRIICWNADELKKPPFSGQKY